MTDQNDDGNDGSGAPPPPADATRVVPRAPSQAPPPQPLGGPQAYPAQQPFAGPQAYPAQQPAPPPSPAYGQPAPSPFVAQPYGHALPATGSTTRRRSGGVIAGALTMLAGGLFAILGAFLPWLSSERGGFDDLPNGFETYPFFQNGDDSLIWTNPGAWIIGFYALVSLFPIIVLSVGKATWSSVCGIVATLIAGAVALLAVAGIADLASNFRELDIGAGIGLILVAALVAFLGSLIVAIVG